MQSDRESNTRPQDCDQTAERPGKLGPKFESESKIFPEFETKPGLQIDSESDRKPKALSHWFNDDTLPVSLVEIIITASCASSDSSAGDATLDTLEVFQIDAEDITFNYRGPKVLPKNECHATICNANTIGALRSRKLLQVLLDSVSNACQSKRTALPSGLISKNLA